MLSTKSDSFDQEIIHNLQDYGLDEIEVKIYLFLLANASKTALQISRDLKLARTKVYRTLDKLLEKNLAVTELQSAGMRFLAESPTQLSLLLNQRATDLDKLKNSHSNLLSELETLAGHYQQAGSEVKYYTGMNGLRQVTLNSLAAKRQLLIFELNQDMSKLVDYDLAEDARREFAAKKTTIFQLTNLAKILPYTEVSALIENYWKVRYLNPKDFKIEFEVLIYNDIYALYTYDRGEAFCVEIHNPHLAKMQRQLFKFAWKQAKPMKILDGFGAAELD